MLIIFCLFVTFVGIAVAALAVFGSQPIGTYLHIRATTDKTTDAAADTRLFATLLALSGELDVTMLSLRFSVAQTAALVEEWLDADSLRLVENILGTRVPRSYSSASPAKVLSMGKPAKPEKYFCCQPMPVRPSSTRPVPNGFSLILPEPLPKELSDHRTRTRALSQNGPLQPLSHPQWDPF